jgi:Zn-dependent protease with chaperone function
LAGLADIPVPDLALVESDGANGLAVGLTRRRSVVVVTRGLVDRLEPKEPSRVTASTRPIAARYCSPGLRNS